MKNLLSIISGILLLLCGCSSRYIDVGGEKYEMISEKEEKELVERARLAISRINSRLKGYEQQIIREKTPSIRFFYSGDRYGRATFSWKTPDREVGVNYEGEFLSEHMSCRVYTKANPGEEIDARKVLPVRRGGRKSINKK